MIWLKLLLPDPEDVTNFEGDFAPLARGQQRLKGTLRLLASTLRSHT